MNEFKSKIARLIDLKSLITILLIVVLSYETIIHFEEVYDLFKTVLTMVITYYFTRKGDST